MDHTNAPTAVVTGARRGIGRGIAFALAEAGWRRLVLLDRVEDAETAATLEGVAERGAEAVFLRADIADVDRAAAVAETAFSAFGRVDAPVSYTHLRAHETKANLVCRLLLEKKKHI